MNEFTNVVGKIFIAPRNKMNGLVSVIGSQKDNLTSKIHVTQHQSILSRINVYTDEVVIQPSYPPTISNQRKGYLRVPNRQNLISNIKILPRNKMTALVEIIVPPTYTLELHSIKDSFIRSQIPTLNYGNAESMLVGNRNNDNEAYRSLVEFDDSQIPKNAKIVSAKLKLYNTQINTGTHQVGVYTFSSEWLEDGVTWVNQPAIKDLISITSLGETGFSDIDVTEAVVNWYSGLEKNNGLILKAMNETYSQREQFSTRESQFNKPILEVSYKLDVVYSSGRSNLNSNIFIHAVDSNQLKGSLNIREYDTSRELNSTLRVTNFNYMLESNISINKPSLSSYLTVKRKDEHNITSTIQVRVKGGYLPQDNLRSNINVSIKNRVGHIKVPSRSNVASKLNVRVYQNDRNNIVSNLVVTKDRVHGTIIIRRTGKDKLFGNIKTRIHKDQYGKLLISRKSVLSHIRVTDYDQITGHLTVNQVEEIKSIITIPTRKSLPSKINIIHSSHVPSSIFVLSGFLRSNIKIPDYGEYVVKSRITVRVRSISEIRSNINIVGDNIHGGFVYIL
ncbi:DNRLRE domain-containing protein [Paenibacillus paeoniae]|uniref:Carbohydrate-binding module family 96 domain-containing protein n=1 Tax=Paenibacillus paeoniae TaxID=2292705 RepID=A0A371PJE3_9BACL|nr:DNRLRE domain-containing protein [Paenibacillus paeoniae]REK76294.1 hypothetical protein DX130_04410 [Paenibacillus paeoniae]